MARLPSAEALGSLPSASSGRQISNIDASAIGQGMQSAASGMRALAAGQAAQARGISQMGQQIAEGIDIAARSFKQDDDLNDAQTRADFLVEKIKLDNERDNEIDPDKLRSFPERYQKLTETFATRYSDPKRKQKFLIETQDDVARGGLAAGDKVLRIERDTFKASAMDRLEQLRRSGLEAKDEPTKQRVIAQGMEQFKLLREKGIIDASQEVSARQKWVRDYTIDSIKMLPAGQRLVAARGNDGALAVRESGGDHTKENQFGFAGTYQFGAPRLQTIGVYTPGGGENLDTWNNTGKTAPGKWSGTFNIPGFPNVRTKAEFLANPEAQEKVYQLHQAKIGQEIKANGLDKYIGQTVGGVKITEDGIRNMIHLGGAGGAKLFLTSGGVIDRADANGTKLSEYAAMGASSKASKMMDFLDPLERRSIEEGATQELMQQSRAAEAEERQFRAIQTAERAAVLDDLQIGIAEDRYGPAEVMQARQAGLLTDPEKFNKIEKLLKDQGERRDRAELLTGVMNGTTTYNPTDPNHTKAAEEGVDAVAKATGLPREQAAFTIYDRTGVMPKTGVQAMRGLIYQNTPDSIMAVGNMASRAMYETSARFPNGNQRVFDGFDGGKEVSEIGTLFKHYSALVGPEEAAKRIVQMKSPDFKSPVKMGEKEEQEFVKGLKDNAAKDMGNADLFGSSVVWDNKTLPGPLRNQVLEDYASEALFYYKKYGDEDAAKKFAMDAVKKVYGVSNGFIQKFPVEKAYQNYQIGTKGTDWVYDQAIEKVKSVAGATVKKEDVFFTEVPIATAEAFRAGREPPYFIHYFRDVNGQRVLERLPNAVMPNAAKAYSEHLTRVETEARQDWNAERNLRSPSPVVTPEQIPERSFAPGRPVRTPEQRKAAADEATAFRTQRKAEAAIAAPSMEAKQAARDEALKGAEDSLVGSWFRNTPPLKDAMPKFKLGPNRNRLPGGEK